MPAKLTTQTFIEKARAVHGERYDYTLAVYSLSKDPITIICPTHGKFIQTANAHISGGTGCPICYKAHNSQIIFAFSNEFIVRARAKHGDKYDYSQSIYTGAKFAITIICPTHGPFTQKAHKHLLGCGCPICGKSQIGSRVNQEAAQAFLEQAHYVHGDRYDYTNTFYHSARNKINIFCPIHGHFAQLPQHHLRGNGCLKCARAVHAERTGGYSKTGWISRQRGRTAILYLLRLFTKTESFFKVGRTFHLSDRRSCIRPTYSSEVALLYKSDDACKVWDMEREFLNRFKYLKYSPKKSFAGQHECLKESEEILNAFSVL